MSSPCEVLTWDSEFFGFPVARVTERTLTTRRGRDVVEWCEREGIRFLYLLAGDDPPTWAVASGAGFQLVDLRVELVLDRNWPRLPETPLGSGVCLREATDADLTALLPIAASVHTDSRFFVDPSVPRQKARELFSLWLQRSVQHQIADVVFVADVGGVAAAYISARVSHHVGSIGVVGVGEGARGQGIGLALVQHTLRWFAARKATKVSVVTQGRNVMAQRVYQRCGFLTGSVDLWFHRWFA